MKYQQPSFSVPATNGSGSCDKGHAMPDQRGKCIRCGEKAEVRHVGVTRRGLHEIELVEVSEQQYREVFAVEFTLTYVEEDA